MPGRGHRGRNSSGPGSACSLPLARWVRYCTADRNWGVGGSKNCRNPVLAPASCFPRDAWPQCRVGVDRNAHHPFRFTDTLLVSGAVLIGNTERLPDRALILPVLHEMGTVSMIRAMNTIRTAARVGT